MTEKLFRFEDFDIWREGIGISQTLFQYARILENRKQYAFADQLRRATISITNNIAEGSGSTSKKDFHHFLTMSRRSLYECANLIFLLEKQEFISTDQKYATLTDLSLLGKKITNFQKYLRG